jgi:hypothetical protein
MAPTMSHTLQGRVPLILQPQDEPAATGYLPKAQELAREWHLVASSDPFWKNNQIYSVAMTFSLPVPPADDQIASLTALKPLGNVLTCRSSNSFLQLRLDGMSFSSSPTMPGVFNWCAIGRVGVLKGQWEIMAYQSRQDFEASILVIFGAKPQNTPQSLSVYCDAKNGISKERLEEVLEALEEICGESLARDVHNIYPIS